MITPDPKKGIQYFRIIEKKNLKRIRENEAILIATEYNDTDNPKHLKWIINKMVKILAAEYYPDVVNGIDYKWDKGIRPKRK